MPALSCWWSSSRAAWFERSSSSEIGDAVDCSRYRYALYPLIGDIRQVTIKSCVHLGLHCRAGYGQFEHTRPTVRLCKIPSWRTVRETDGERSSRHSLLPSGHRPSWLPNHCQDNAITPIKIQNARELKLRTRQYRSAQMSVCVMLPCRCKNNNEGSRCC